MDDISFQTLLATFVLLWAVIDPIGTIPVFISATRDRTDEELKKIAAVSALAGGGILLFFLIAGEIILRAMGVPLQAFQIAGGLVLFLFALTMIFGESKPEGEVRMCRSVHETAIFPLATPSIASPGAMMAIVLLTENSRHSLLQQTLTGVIMILVVFIVYLLMRIAVKLSRFIGEAGASIISRVMGLILASIAATNVLAGIKEYFS
ncbi:MAG: MarC family protein [Verrucomicrobiota bacterium]